MQFDKINKIFTNCEQLKNIVIMHNDDIANSYDYVHKYDDFINNGKSYITDNNISIKELTKSVSENDLLIIHFKQQCVIGLEHYNGIIARE